MNSDIERNLGEQPITRIMLERGLTRSDLVSASNRHITHKMVARACKGRRLTPHAQRLILAAINQLSNSEYSLADLFNY